MHIICIALALENTIYSAISYFPLAFPQLTHSKYKFSVGFESLYNVGYINYKGVEIGFLVTSVSRIPVSEYFSYTASFDSNPECL